jgi:TrmH family RNA methyltransferase
MISSPDNQHLKTIRKLHQKHWRERLGLFIAEGEDLVLAAEAAGWEPETVLVAGDDVEPDLLASASTLGSGTRAIGIYLQRWSDAGGELSVYLHGVGDPGNLGAIVRAAHALCDGPVTLGPDCADPFSPKAVRASMGSVFARPPARAGFERLEGTRIALDPRADRTLTHVERALVAPVVLCLGAEREGLPQELVESAELAARIPARPDGPESLGVAAAAAIGLYELGTRMAGHA